MTKSFSKKLLLVLLALMMFSGVVLLTGCQGEKMLTNSFSSSVQTFKVGDTKATALAGITVTYTHPTDSSLNKTFTGADLLKPENNITVFISLSTPTEKDAEGKDVTRVCTIGYEGQTTTFEYIVTA